MIRQPPSSTLFPTRRSSDLMGTPATPAYWKTNPAWGNADDVNRVVLPTVTFHDRMSLYYGDTKVDFEWPRSEEHTSELQSRRDLVCRLLLEKKKDNRIYEHV